MDIVFQGFQSSLPFWFYLLILGSTTFLAWWSYRSVKGIKKSYRYVLIFLRSSVFFILLVLLLNPFLKTEKPYFEKPNILVLLDNSASTSVQKSEYDGRESYRQLLNTLNFSGSEDITFDFYAFGSSPVPSRPDSLTFDAERTNLNEVMYLIKGQQEKINASLLITDGIYTQGQNPVFETNNMQTPIFTVGLGDTTFQKDLLVTSAVTNTTGYLDTRQPVTATVSSKGFKGEPFQVRLQKEDEIIATKTVNPDISNSMREVTFELSLTSEGLQQYQIVIPERSGEWTAANNTQLFSIDVKDARQQILSLAFEVHPDVRFVRSILLGDKNTNLTTRTWLGRGRFIEGTLNVDPDTVDLAIVHGYPQGGVSRELNEKLSEIAQQVPLIVVSTPLFNRDLFEQEITPLPVTASGQWEYSPVYLNPAAGPTEHPIMELPALAYDRISPVAAPVENIDSSPGAKVLFSSLFRGNETQKPVLAVQELGNKRIAFFAGYEWFRLGQSGNPQVRDFVQKLWLNTISWAATDPEKQKLDVRPAQKSFTGSEPVIINAFLANERGEMESGATIDISISSDSVDTKFYSMENEGAGRYQLDLGAMPEGVYAFEATAQKGNRTIESRKGEFAVARSNAEFLDVHRNEQLLRQLAERTGGHYFPFDSVSGIWNVMEQQQLLDQTRKVETTYLYPYRHLLWFILVLVLLSAEWIFRKYLSLP